VPVLLLLPLKFLGLRMLAHGSWLGALGVLAFAKMVSVGVTAFIFDVTQPKLMQLAWFRWLYGRVVAGLAWAHGLIDPIKRRLRSWLRMWRPRRAGRTLRLLRAHPSPDAGGVTRQIRWSECRYSGWKNPNAMMARPTTPRPPAMYASAIMPVMTAADASTMPI
jgi:hypothetical protein